MASSIVFPLLSCNLNLLKKCIVSSTAMPKATVKMIEVEALSGIPTNPMTAAAMSKGNILAINEIRTIVRLLKSKAIMILTAAKATAKPLNKLERK